MLANRLIRAAAATFALAAAACSPGPAKVSLTAEQAKQVEDDLALFDQYLKTPEDVRVAQISLAANRFRVLGDDLAKAVDDEAFDQAAAVFSKESIVVSAKSVRAYKREDLIALVEGYVTTVKTFQNDWLAAPAGE